MTKIHPTMLNILRNVGIAFLALSAGILMRKYLLGALEGRIIWVTFYPAVVIGSIFGGWFAGALVAGGACMVAVHGWWLIWNKPFIKDYGDWLGLYAFLFNCLMIAAIAEMMRRARLRAERAKEEADKANKAKSIFLANMSHELRTPLNAILGFSNLLKNSLDLSVENRKNSEIIANSGENLLNLINNILDISKMEAGHMVNEETSINLHQLLFELESLLSVRIKEKGLEFNLKIADTFPVYAVLDGGKLRQVLINLIANATKYTTIGTVSVMVSIGKPLSKNTTPLHFEVKDTGIGISEEDQQQIFRPFKQVGVQPTAHTGTGLGLSICKQFIELMGGEIGVKSESGKGSSFYFEIPAKDAPAPSKSIVANPRKRITGIKPGQPQYRILIAEDKLENRLLLQRLLEPFGFELHEAITGEEVISQFKKCHPDLILMDIRMPVMDGMEATKRIRQYTNGAQTRIVALSAHVLDEERLEILKSGCDDVIRKPYRDTEIYDILVRYLGVEFIYDTSDPLAESTSCKKLDLSALTNLPAELRESLRKALVLLDNKRCSDVIANIERIDSDLSVQLRMLIDDFKHMYLLNLLDKSADSKGVPE